MEWIIGGAVVAVVLAVWLGIIGALGYLGWLLTSSTRETRYGWEPQRGFDWRVGPVRWALAIGVWLLAAGIFFGALGYVADRAQKSCAEKGGHLVQSGKYSTCVVTPVLDDGELG